MTLASPTLAGACGLCRRNEARELFRKDGVPYFACRACGFRFARPARNPNLANRIEDYEAAYLQYLRDDPADQANFDAQRHWMSRFAQLEGCALLDVGCGSGKLVRYLRARGVEAHGIEPSVALYQEFLAGDAAFVHGTLESLGARPGERFDVVTAFDVLEHVDDPRALLEGVAAVLAPGGLLFVSTPDVASLPARLLGPRWHYYNAYHLSYFDERTLTRLAASLGFELLEHAHLGRRRSLGYLARYLANFVLRRDAPAFLARLDALTVPINFFDVLYVCLRRTRA